MLWNPWVFAIIAALLLVALLAPEYILTLISEKTMKVLRIVLLVILAVMLLAYLLSPAGGG